MATQILEKDMDQRHQPALSKHCEIHYPTYVSCTRQDVLYSQQAHQHGNQSQMNYTQLRKRWQPAHRLCQL